MSSATPDIAGLAITLPPSFDAADLRPRLEALLGVEIEDLTRFPSGFSWITYGFAADVPAWRSGRAEYILRLGPANGLFAPYSAAPQFHALRLLQDTSVPTPAVYAWSDDPQALGAPYFFSEKSLGDTPLPWGRDELKDDVRYQLGVQFAEAIADVHNVSWQGSPLAELETLPTVDSAAALQIDQWEADYRRWRLRPHPMIHRALSWLRAHQPAAPRVAIVHGDYRLGNFLAIGDRMTAVLDWELVHLGDPHEDLAWACLPQYRGGTPLMSKLIARDELYDRYGARAGFSVDKHSMHFYTVFSLLKLAITHMAGVSAFESRGFNDMRMSGMGTQIAPVLRQIEKTIEAGA